VTAGRAKDKRARQKVSPTCNLTFSPRSAFKTPRLGMPGWAEYIAQILVFAMSMSAFSQSLIVVFRDTCHRLRSPKHVFSPLAPVLALVGGQSVSKDSVNSYLGDSFVPPNLLVVAQPCDGGGITLYRLAAFHCNQQYLNDLRTLTIFKSSTYCAQDYRRSDEGTMRFGCPLKQAVPSHKVLWHAYSLTSAIGTTIRCPLFI
jgi:hypothetical protein